MSMPTYYSILLISILTLAGCANVTSQYARDGALENLGNIVVVHNTEDPQHLEEQIAVDLKQRGLNAVSMTDASIPHDADTLLYYVPYWVEVAHDHTLHVHIHDARTHELLASATSSRSLFQNTNAPNIVKRTLDSLFAQNK